VAPLVRRAWDRLRAQLGRPVVLALLLVLLPALVALAFEARDGRWRQIPFGDGAVLELHLRQALRGKHLLGPYSQYEWYHPGPLYYYLLAPLYVLSGSSTRSMHFSAGLIYASALCTTLLVHLGRDRRSETRLVFLAGLAFALLTFLVRPPPALDAAPITEIWNPLVPVMPFLLALVCAAAVASGSLEFVPLLAFLQAFTCQTHVSYLVCSVVLLVVAVAVGLFAARQRPRSYVYRWVGLAAVVSLACWLAPLVAIARGEPGNFLDVLRFVFSATRPHVGALTGIAYAFRQLHWVLLHPFGLDDGARTVLAVALSALQCGTAVVFARASLRRREPYLAALGAAPVLVTLVALAQGASLTSVDEDVAYYQSLWFDVSGSFAWLAALFLASRASGSLSVTFRRGASGLAFVSVVVYAVVAVGLIARDFARCRERGVHRVTLPAGLLESAKSIARRRIGGGRLAFEPASPGSWGVLAALALQLSKREVDIPISARWRFMYGNGARYIRTRGPRVDVAVGVQHGAPVWRAFDGYGLYVHGLEKVKKPATAAEPPLTCRLERAEGVLGDAERLCDGKTAQTGTPWDGPEHVQLKDMNSRVTIGLPTPGPGTYLAGVSIESDNNDLYDVEASTNGTDFVRLGTTEGGQGAGMRWFAFYFNDLVPWRMIRITPKVTDGILSLAEIRPIAIDGTFVEFGGKEKSETVAVSLRPGDRYDAVLKFELLPTPRAEQPMGVYLNGKRLAEVQVEPFTTYATFSLPANVVTDENILSFALPAQSPGTPPLKPRLYGALFRRSL